MFTPAFNSSVTVGRPAADISVGTQSSCDIMSFKIVPAGILLGQRIMAGTRKPPSQLVFFSLLKGVIAASGQVLKCGPLSVL